eukprot:gene6045-23160_t
MSIDSFTTAIQGVAFSTSDTTGLSRRVTYNYGDALFSTTTGKYYQHFPESVSWLDGQKKCASTNLLSMLGYLATITSSEENAAVKSLGGQGWIGATDLYTENEWRWVAGPEGKMGKAADGGGCPAYAAGATACDVQPGTGMTGTAGDANKGMVIGRGSPWAAADSAIT